MKLTRLFAALASFLFLAGCTPISLNPFFTQQDLTRDAGFPGVWQNVEDADRLVCEESKTIGYECEVIEKGAGSAGFQIQLMRLGNDLFLDIYPDDPHIAHGLLSAHLLPVHTLARMRHDGDSLRIAVLDTGWVKRKIADKTLDLAHQFRGEKEEDLFLAAPTNDLRALLLTASADPKAFTEPDEYRRVR